jgi:hypothetical protein
VVVRGIALSRYESNRWKLASQLGAYVVVKRMLSRRRSSVKERQERDGSNIANENNWDSRKHVVGEDRLELILRRQG